MTAPFRKQTEQTLFLRPTFSADASLVCAANAVQSSKPVAAMLGRASLSVEDTETPPTYLVGHQSPIVATRFNPMMFEPKKPNGKSKPKAASNKPVGCLALGGVDGMVTVWVTNSLRPTILRDLFTSSVTDLSWSRGALECGRVGTAPPPLPLPPQLPPPLPRHRHNYRHCHRRRPLVLSRRLQSGCVVAERPDPRRELYRG